MNKATLAALFVALCTPNPAAAQDEAPRTFRLKNTTSAAVSCRIAAGEAVVETTIAPGTRWKANMDSPDVIASCNPPVKQLGYRMAGNTKYILLREKVGDEIEIVAVTK